MPNLYGWNFLYRQFGYDFDSSASLERETFYWSSPILNCLAPIEQRFRNMQREKQRGSTYSWLTSNETGLLCHIHKKYGFRKAKSHQLNEFALKLLTRCTNTLSQCEVLQTGRGGGHQMASTTWIAVYWQRSLGSIITYIYPISTSLTRFINFIANSFRFDPT